MLFRNTVAVSKSLVQEPTNWLLRHCTCHAKWYEKGKWWRANV